MRHGAGDQTILLCSLNLCTTIMPNIKQFQSWKSQSSKQGYWLSGSDFVMCMIINIVNEIIKCIVIDQMSAIKF